MAHDVDKSQLYEKKIIEDQEFPIQFFENSPHNKGEYFCLHWHEHIELHYVMSGRGIFYCNQKKIMAEKGSLVVINSNELHRGIVEDKNMKAFVMIFELSAFSREVAHAGIVFRNLIEDDTRIQGMMREFSKECENQEIGYKLACKGILYQLITYLMRNYAVLKLNEIENSKRNKNLIRLNTVIQYIQEHYTETISNQTLAEMVHLSEDRFNHLFKESMGISPLNYVNDIRLKKADNLLKTGEYTVGEAASMAGFGDINHFGRLFRKKYGCTPSSVSSR